MKPALELKVSQQLKMTPQLRQAIHLLQLSRLELDQEIRETLEENPLLEEVTPGTEDEYEADVDSEPTTTMEVANTTSTTEPETRENTPDDSVDTDWDAGVEPDYPVMGGAGGDDDELPSLEARNSAPETLGDHLLWQVHMAPLSETDRAIAEALIASINDEGYQTATLAEVAETLEVDEDDVHAVHVWVMHLDPLGVGARDLAECLDAQLDLAPADTPALDTARRIVRHHLEALGQHDYKALRKALKAEDDEIDAAVALIRTLNPRPGTVIGGEAAPTVVPDVIVRHSGDRWQVELNGEAIPRLRVNSAYADLARGGGDREAKKYVRDHLQQARWFIKSLASRNETLLKVATAIVERQQGFLEHGPTAMRPMVLRDIAEAVELHESTVSRVTTQKYMHTPQGVFELKYFFSSQLGTTDGEGVSATAIRAMLQRLVDEEDPAKPYSDARLAEILKEQGYEVARRTVVKYRQALDIPSSSQRKRRSRR
jgi:RNA polymerase sigma-54 factor